MSDRELDTLWQHAESAWDDPKAHDALLDHCRRTLTLAEAARRYRSVLDGKNDAYRDNARAAVAQKQLDKIAALALASLQQERTTPATLSTPRWVYAAVGALIVLALYAIARAFG